MRQRADPRRVRLVLSTLALACTLALPTALGQEQVHLGLADEDALAGYTVSWVVAEPGGPTALTYHGPDGDVAIEGRQVLGPTPGLVYEATLPDLTGLDRAAYSVGSERVELDLPANRTLRVAAIGDMGTTRAAGDAVRTIGEAAPDLVFHVGDVSYAGGDPLTWKAWFDLVEPVASRIPWVPALGNHEGDVMGLTRDEASVIDPNEQAFFQQRFPLPGDDFWYSFRYDQGVKVHFLALDTFSWITVPEEERPWLEAELARAADADWVIAYLHEPPYSSNDNHGSSPRAHEAFVDVLEAAGVDLVVTGHDHHYERTHVLRGDEVVFRGNESEKGAGTVYLVTGGGGASLYTEFIDQPEWSAFREAVHHVVLLDITSERLSARAVATEDGRVVDAFSIVRPTEAHEEGPTPSATPGPGIALALLAAAIAFGLRARR